MLFKIIKKYFENSKILGFLGIKIEINQWAIGLGLFELIKALPHDGRNNKQLLWIEFNDSDWFLIFLATQTVKYCTTLKILSY